MRCPFSVNAQRPHKQGIVQCPARLLGVDNCSRGVERHGSWDSQPVRYGVSCPLLSSQSSSSRRTHPVTTLMPGITMNAQPASSVLPFAGFLSQPWEGQTARLASRRLKSSVAVIKAHGGIDASNADALIDYTLGHLMRCRGLILDLRDLDFFGIEGFAALHRVSVCCARAGIDRKSVV